MSSHRFASMGCEIVVGGADPEAREAIAALFDDRDRMFSRFRADSELNRVNESAGRPVRVSREFASMLALALEVARQTDDLVVPTLGAELEAPEYGLQPPAISAQSREIALIGRHVLQPAEIQIDLNGVVKSKTVDDALALLSGKGFVSAGGDIGVRGGAVVALPAGGSVELVRGALATSGTDRRGHHLIDPRTGRPSCSRWLQVTACGATCVAADVAAKAAFLLGDAGPEWLDARGIPGRFVRADGSVQTNDRWQRGIERELACT